MLNKILDFLFPPFCISCHVSNVSAENILCQKCLGNIKADKTFLCGKCFARLPSGIKICHKDFPYILGAASYYGSMEIRALIHGLKFRHAQAASLTLANLLITFFEQAPSSFPINTFSVIPIPLSHKRERERGYNQAELIADKFAAHFGLTMEKNVLQRIRNTEEQNKIRDYELRKQNMENSFGIEDPTKVAKRNFIVIDDVTTSGSTFYEATKTLKKCGARTIIALAAARAS